MPSHYRAGADQERALVTMARADGALAYRTAGSKGTADVFVWAPRNGIHRPRCYAVNVKRNTWAPEPERVAMWAAWPDYGVVPLVARVDVSAGTRALWSFRAVMAGGVMGSDMGSVPWAR